MLMFGQIRCAKGRSPWHPACLGVLGGGKDTKVCCCCSEAQGLPGFICRPPTHTSLPGPVHSPLSFPCLSALASRLGGQERAVFLFGLASPLIPSAVSVCWLFPQIASSIWTPRQFSVCGMSIVFGTEQMKVRILTVMCANCIYDLGQICPLSPFLHL